MPNAAAPSWEPLWDDIFASRSWGAYPSENLIRFIARNYYNAPDRKQIKILDLGAGTGANTIYLAREGFDTYAIDGSAVAVDIIAQKLKRESLEASLASGDIGTLPYADNSMDCIVEINCVMCNNFDNSKKIIQHAVSALSTRYHVRKRRLMGRWSGRKNRRRNIQRRGRWALCTHGHGSFPKK